MDLGKSLPIMVSGGFFNWGVFLATSLSQASAEIRLAIFIFLYRLENFFRLRIQIKLEKRKEAVIKILSLDIYLKDLGPPVFRKPFFWPTKCLLEYRRGFESFHQ